MEDWKAGRTLNPFNHDEIIEAIKWLIKFQDDSKQDRLTKNDIIDDISMIKNEMKKYEKLDKTNFKNWLEKYEEFILKNNIRKTAIHGDFWYTNMLYDKKHKKVSLVDWENYRDIGNPFVDLITFVIRLMMLSPTNEIQSFKGKMYDNGNFNKLMSQVCDLINNHFQCNVDVGLLIKISILRTVMINITYKNEAYYTYDKLLHIIEDSGFSFCTNSDE
jgi:thiamine kinase-like enzyme